MSILFPAYSRKCPERLDEPSIELKNLNLILGIIPLENVSVRVVDGEGDKKWQFELFSNDKAVETVKGCKTDKAGAVVIGNHKVYKMAASTEEDRDVWMKCIKEAVKDNPVQRILSEKKNACKQGIIACKNNIA